MKIKIVFIFLMLCALIASSFFSYRSEYIDDGTADGYRVDTLATGLTVPWELVFLPDKTLLFTERNGKVGLYRNNQLSQKPVLLLDDVEVKGKMGLLGICLHPQFSQNRYVYLSYNYREANTALLKIVRYRFEQDSLVDPLIILREIRAGFNHTGCRLKFGADGRLYITTGDADRPALAQDLKSLNGKILRVSDDGSIPADNPFVGNDTARKEIWSYGHRNAQGIDFEPASGRLFSAEHGPTGGDEINLIEKGNNYGWPLVHHQEIKEGMTGPVLEYSPSIGPSAMVFYSANAFPALKGKLLLACLRGEKIMQFRWTGNKLMEQENVLQQQYGRIRALAVGADGYIYFSTSQNDPPEGKGGAGYDMILRLRPSIVKKTASKMVVAQKTQSLKATAVNKTPGVLYQQLCASCHGRNLEGTASGQSLRDNKWQYGSKRVRIIQNISKGIPDKGMPGWQGALSPKEIERLADFILAKAKKP